jgi:hypothetical protein
MQIDIFECKNISGINENCAPKEEIDKVLQNSLYVFYYIDSNVDPTNYKKPFEQITTLKTSFSSNLY